MRLTSLALNGDRGDSAAHSELVARVVDIELNVLRLLVDLITQFDVANDLVEGSERGRHLVPFC